MGQIIALAVGTRQPGIRLTVTDRIDLFRWEAEQPVGMLGRVTLHEDVPCEDDEHVAFILVSRAGRCWADWGLARCAQGIMLWACPDGTDFGNFATMADALERLSQLLRPDAAQAPRPERRIAATREAALARATLAPGGDAAACLDRRSRITGCSARCAATQPG